MSRKRHINDIRTQGLKRQHKPLTATHKRVVKIFDKETEHINKLIAKAVNDVTDRQRTYEIVSSTSDIVDGVAFTLLGELPKLSISLREKLQRFMV